MERIFESELAGRKLVIETGKLAQLASGCVLVRYGETVVLATATMSEKPREGIDFFPLSVDYEEKLYAVGKIPGGFIRREGKPSEKAVLTSRVIDRPIRPLFPSDLRNDVTVITTVLSVDQDNAPEIAAMIGASAAISISNIPFNGPIAGVQVGLVDGEIVINPTQEQREKSTLQLTVSGTKSKINMIEAGASEVPEDIMYSAILKAHEHIVLVCEFIETIVAEVGKEKVGYDRIIVEESLLDEIKSQFTDKVKVALDTDDKRIRDQRLRPIYEEAYAYFAEREIETSKIDEAMYKLQKYIVRRWILDEGKRVDGRGLLDIRPLYSEVGLLPRVHGSGLFQRGQTQVLTTVTLGAMGDVQMLDGIDLDETKRYMHHYNFPSYSVGETRPSRGPGRREIGHGALAEKALEPVIPPETEFPYAIRLVSEVLSSNGSTSQGSVCASTLALMDAGVPIKAPVAGISCGLVTEGDRFITMTDIQGLEDFFGDMDFKVAGTKNGITAIQVDIKIDGLTPEIIERALYQTKDARIKILDEAMLPCIGEARTELSKYAPKIITMSIDPDKIRDVIGSGGKTIQKIIAETGVKIDIEDDGSVYIAATNAEAGQMALNIIKGIVSDVEPGQIFEGKVVRIMTFGAFVEFLPGKDGLIHISKLDRKRVEKVEDVVNIGDSVTVKVLEVDKMGRINLMRVVPEETKTEITEN